MQQVEVRNGRLGLDGPRHGVARFEQRPIEALAIKRDQHPPLGHAPRKLEQQRMRSEEHTSELQSQSNLVCRLLLEKKKKTQRQDRKSTHINSMHTQLSYAAASSSTNA